MLLTVSICTYNRCEILRKGIEAILAQRVPDGVEWEFLVVDNNSTDGTRDLIHSYCARHSRVRYCFEPKQGVSNGRNLATREARGEIIAFTDDDIQPAPDWLANIVRIATEHPDWAFFGGKVLPSNPEQFPSWLTPGHYSPLALLDRGDTPTILGLNTGLLVGANLTIRKKLMEVAAFDPKLGLVKRITGSIEDEDYLQQALAAGRTGAYAPASVVYTEVQPERLHWKYHLRWSWNHGWFNAMRWMPEWEKSSYNWLGTPGHVWRQGLESALRVPLSIFNPPELLHKVNRVLWAVSFIRHRRQLRAKTRS